jgi:glycosyltransferase involved in cell wall biosynthesis
MKIAIISSTFPSAKPGGVPTYVDGRASYLAKKTNVRVYALGDARHLENFATYDQVSIGEVRKFRHTAFASWFKLLRDIYLWKPDVIEIHNIPVGLPLFFFHKVLSLRKPSYFFHGPAALEAKIEGANKFQCMSRMILERACLRRSKLVYCVSNAFKKVLLEQHSFMAIASKNIRIRYPKMNFKELPEVSSLTSTSHASKEKVYICIRRLVERTGVLQLVESFIALYLDGQIDPESTLVVLGDGPLKQTIEDSVREAGLEMNVKILGYVSEEERDLWFTKATFNVVPTIGLEGFGLVVVEAALLGCPSIVTDVNALPEVIEALNGVGLVVPPTRQGLETGLVEASPLSQKERRELMLHTRRRFGLQNSSTMT